MTTRDEYVYQLMNVDEEMRMFQASLSEAKLPPMYVKPDLGRLLTILTASSWTSRALEIGTFVGYSAACIARGLPKDGHLTSLEVRDQHAEIAKRNLTALGLIHQVDIVTGEALTSLAKLQAEGATFGLIFIDADKPNYPRYLQYALSLSTTGTLIIADNVFARDRVLEDNPNPTPSAMRIFNETIASHERLQTTILPIHDGFAVARVMENPT